MAELYEKVFVNEEDDSILPEDKKYKSSFKKRLCFSAVFLALSVAFSFFSIIDPDIENTLMPMHIPVLLGSFVCGGPLGFMIGLLSPLLKYIISPEGAFFSETMCYCFELAVCGCMGGYLFRAFSPKWPFVALNVAISLLVSKVTFFVLKYLMTIFFSGTDLAPETFISQRLTPSIIGIVCQIIIIPTVVIVFQKAGIAFVKTHESE